jgi:hypothetical protein
MGHEEPGETCVVGRGGTDGADDDDDDDDDGDSDGEDCGGFVACESGESEVAATAVSWRLKIFQVQAWQSE